MPSLDKTQKSDVVIGSRYLQNKSQVPKHRIFGHRVFNWFTSLASGVGSTDSQSGFRAFSPKALEVLNFSSDGFSVESEMQLIAREHNLKITEAPITVVYKEEPKRNVIQHGLLVINGILRLTGQYRPLLFFGVPGLIILIAGLIWGWRVVFRPGVDEPAPADPGLRPVRGGGMRGLPRPRDPGRVHGPRGGAEI